MNFLDRLPRAQRNLLIRKVVALESGQTKAKTQAELLAQALLRRTLGKGRIFRTGGEIDYHG